MYQCYIDFSVCDDSLKIKYLLKNKSGFAGEI